LDDVEEIYGTLSVDNISSFVTNGIDTNSLPSNVTCTNCLKEAYNIVNDKYPGSIGQDVVDQQCGSNFTGENLSRRLSYNIILNILYRWPDTFRHLPERIY
jgi:hypothetical protein